MPVVEEVKPAVIGAAPEGVQGQDSVALAVREMFSSIAPRYDLLNHVLSFNVDRMWWRRTARAFTHVLSRTDSRVLDLCCGTGDMTFALRREVESNRRSALPSRDGRMSPSPHQHPQILGADFSHAMLQRAAFKSDTRNRSSAHEIRPAWIEADALRLPFADGYFDLITSAFGFRNLADYDGGLREIYRVLRPGGECGILECGNPKGPMGAVYRIYFRQVLPRIGTLISGVRGPYAYLPASVERFPEPQEMMERMKKVGFAEARWTPYTFGIAGLYRGRKASA
jgi:demethylmenaquinone methyltransferase / 2-methoxy-6-polyprenyl-1,4-benzoquinol methylase